MNRQRRINYQHQSEAANARNRHKVLDGVVVDILVYEWVSGKRRVGSHQQRVAVRWLMMDVKRCQRSVGTGTIFDNDRLPEHWAELVGNDAADRVAGAARTKDGNKRNWPRWIIVGGMKGRTD